MIPFNNNYSPGLTGTNFISIKLSFLPADVHLESPSEECIIIFYASRFDMASCHCLICGNSCAGIKYVGAALLFIDCYHCQKKDRLFLDILVYPKHMDNITQMYRKIAYVTHPPNVTAWARA